MVGSVRVDPSARISDARSADGRLSKLSSYGEAYMNCTSFARWSAGVGMAIGVIAACGGGHAGGGGGNGPSGFGCSQSVAGQQTCYVYRNLTSAQDSSVRSACSAGGGSVVT